MIRKLRHDQQGATIVLVALSMVVLMGFAAVAIDVAHKRNQRSEDQAAADSGAVAAGLMTVAKLQPLAIADATTEVVRITYQTIQPDMSFAGWQTEWATCSDPDKPAEYTLTGTSDCVSFTSNLSRIRVKTPIVNVTATFGKVLGTNNLLTDAFAEVEATPGAGIGNVLPFGLPGGAAGKSEICLKTGPQPRDEEPCNGPDTGNFGFLDFTRFGLDKPPGTEWIPPACSFNPKPKTVAENIAHGVDHDLWTYDLNGTKLESVVRLDIDVCPTNVSGAPNGTGTSTGNMAKTLDEGFIAGTSQNPSFPGRLSVLNPTPPPGYPPRTDVRGTTEYDNTPLWAYLTNAGQTYCKLSDVVGGPVTNHDDMALCLTQWRLGVGGSARPVGLGDSQRMFSGTIEGSPRFAWVPILTDPNFPNGRKDVLFANFRPVYVQTLFANCSGSGCEDVWDPGEGSSITSGKGFIATTALPLSDGMLPESVTKDKPGTLGRLSYVIIR